MNTKHFLLLACNPNSLTRLHPQKGFPFFSLKDKIQKMINGSSEQLTLIDTAGPDNLFGLHKLPLIAIIRVDMTNEDQMNSFCVRRFTILALKIHNIMHWSFFKNEAIFETQRSIWSLLLSANEHEKENPTQEKNNNATLVRLQFTVAV